MRFAFISPDYLQPAPSSIGLATSQLGRELVRLGHDVVVVALAEEGRAAERIVGQDGVVVLTVPCGKGGRWSEIVTRWRIRRRLIEEDRAMGLDLVEVPDFQGWLPWGAGKIPVRVRLHNSVASLCRFRGAREGLMMRWFERSTLGRAREWAGASRFAFSRTEEVFGFVPPRRVLVPCPVDLGSPDGERPAGLGEGNRFVFCGPLTWLKGGDLFGRIARLAGERGIDGKFVAIGEDPDGRSEKECGSIECLGHLAHPRALDVIGAATAVLVPSRLEFQGIAVAEAMARGVPVLVPRRAPFDEFFTNEEVFFVDGDEAEDWVGQLELLLANELGARRVADSGQAKVQKKFSARTVAQLWLQDV